MALIQNLVARLTLDSQAFDRNSKRAGQSMRSMQSQSLALQRTVVGLAGTYFGARGLIRAASSMAQAAIAQEEAENDLRAALGQSITAHKAYAAEIQKRTRYGDEAVLAEMAYGYNLGITADRLQEATRAAVGLAAKYRIDLKSAMMLVGRASQGQTQMLTRYGIVLDETLNDQQKFTELLRIGAGSFHLAEEAAKSLAGRSEQLANRWGDLKEQLGQPIASAAITSLEKLAGALVAVNSAMKQSPVTVSDQLQSLDPDTRALARDIYNQSYRNRVESQLEPGHLFNPQYHTGPTDYELMRKAIAAAQRSAATQARIREEAMRQSDAAMLRPGEVAAPTEGAMHGPFLTPIDTDAAYKRIMDSYKQPAKATVDVTAAMARMYDEIDSKSEASFTARLSLLQQQRAEYEAMGIAADEWYESQRELWKIEKDMATGGLGGGFRAGISQMTRELQTLGELGADLGASLRDGLVGSLTDAIFEARNLGDALRDVARSMARMATEWMLNQAVTRSLGALFPVAHGGGLVGSTAFPMRAVSPGLFAGAPRLHNGLAGDEFPAILQRGERVIPKGGAGAPTVIVNVRNAGTPQRARVTGQQFDAAMNEMMVTLLLDDAEHGGPVSQRYMTRQ